MRLARWWIENAFQINHAGGGGRSELYVAFASGRSTEFLIRETFDKLDDVREA